jgi:hypothetical protein
MRTCCLAVLLFQAVLASTQQAPIPAGDLSGTLEIPVQLTKTLRADKAHAGDAVEFRTLEAVLVDKEVMPADSRLYGRVLSAAPKRGDKPSWVAVLVERAEWKQHRLPLHAFISGQIALSSKQDAATSTSGNPQPRVNSRRQNLRAALADDPELTSMIKPPQDASGQAQDSVAPSHPPLTHDIRIFRREDGIIYLVSAVSNVKLPGGLLLMLSNRPSSAVSPSPAAAIPR